VSERDKGTLEVRKNGFPTQEIIQKMEGVLNYCSLKAETRHKGQGKGKTMDLLMQRRAHKRMEKKENPIKGKGKNGLGGDGKKTSVPLGERTT